MPGLSLFLWQDGAPFDNVMNHYMSASYPQGIDPATPLLLRLNDSHWLTFGMGDNTTLPTLLSFQ